MSSFPFLATSLLERQGNHTRELGANFPISWKKLLLRNGRAMMRPSAPKPCGWPAARGPTNVPFRTAVPSTWWVVPGRAGRCAPICPKRWSPAPCSGRCWPNGPLPAWSSTPTGVVPGRAGNTWAMSTRPCYATSGPGFRTADAANATTTPSRVRPRPKACGRA